MRASNSFKKSRIYSLTNKKWGKTAIRKSELILIFLLGLTPILWIRPGFIIGSGDAFPFWLDSEVILARDVYLWSSNAMGHASALSTWLPYDIIGYLCRSFGFSLALAQILFQVLFFMGSGFSMYYFSSIIYPENKKAPFVSATFYMFNFFVLQSRLNMGFVTTYAFLPLLLALLTKVVRSTYRCDGRTINKNIIYFSITLAFSLAFASINPSHIVLILLSLAAVLVYHVFIHRRKLRPLISSVIKIAGIVVPLSLWWLIPIANYYVWSPLELNAQVNIASWSWTQNRASLLNLFSLNGFWGWIPMYSPYLNSYSNPFLIALTYIPFLLAGAALVIKSTKSRLNTYVMFIILLFIFLAKGVHEPLGQLNLFLYNYLPGMSMFREPTSKFTMILLPLLPM